MDLEKGSRLDPRRWNWKRANPFGWNWNPLEWSWTTRSVAGRMVGIACAGTIAYAIGWLQAWMPNVVVGSLTVAITVTVVERALRDAERGAQRAREQPIMNVIRTRLDLEMMGFVYALLSDYSTTHLNTDTPIPNTVADLCDIVARRKRRHSASRSPGWGIPLPLARGQDAVEPSEQGARAVRLCGPKEPPSCRRHRALL